MDPNIWSHLPTDIFILIIEASPDATLRACCKATYWSSTLYPFVLAAAYGDTTINAGDLIAYPGAYPGLTAEAASDNNPSRDWRMSETHMSNRAVTAKHVKHNAQNPEGLVNRLVACNPAGVAPAQYIKHLSFQLATATMPGKTPAPPSIEVLEHTISKIFPALRSLQSLRIDDPMYMSTIDAITRSLSPATGQNLNKLIFRRHFSKHGYYKDVDDAGYEFEPADGRPAVEEGGEDGPESSDCRLYFDKLLPSLGHGLKVLEVNEYTFWESKPLADFVENLKVLEELMVRRRWPDPRRSGLAPLPMNELIGPDQHLLGRLPQTLKKLELDDCYSLGDTCPASRIPSASSRPNAHYPDAPSLTSLSLYLDTPTAPTTVLSHCPGSRLEHLTIQAGSKTFSFHTGFPTPSSMVSYLYNDLFSPHLSSLQTITLTNVWYIHHLSLISRLNSVLEMNGFAFTDLVLGTSPCTRPIREYLLRDRILGHQNTDPDPELQSRWGEKLERLRVEELVAELDKVEVSFLGNPALKNLRILILQPVRLPRGDHFPDELDSFAQGRLAKRILEWAPFGLRYISVGDDKFWVDHTGLSEVPRRLMHFRRAFYASGPEEEEVKQKIKREINSWMSHDDREFINPVSAMNEERNDIVAPSFEDLDYQTVVRFNFITARKVSGSVGDG